MLRVFYASPGSCERERGSSTAFDSQIPRGCRQSSEEGNIRLTPADHGTGARTHRGYRTAGLPKGATVLAR